MNAILLLHASLVPALEKAELGALLFLQMEDQFLLNMSERKASVCSSDLAFCLSGGLSKVTSLLL